MPVLFVDIETTGLDLERHVPWEIAIIEENGRERQWLLPLSADDIANADEIALGVGMFHRRHPQGNAYDGNGDMDDPGVAAREIARLTNGAHLCGAIVSFDAYRLERFLAKRHIKQSWHYHLIDVESMAIGFLCGREKILVSDLQAALSIPWKADLLHRAVLGGGLDDPMFEKHTALGDARMAKAVYDTIRAEA